MFSREFISHHQLSPDTIERRKTTISEASHKSDILLSIFMLSCRARHRHSLMEADLREKGELPLPFRVPSLPVDFYDCEEHCKPHENAKQRQIYALEPVSVEISNEELHLMNSVKNKFLEREDNDNIVYADDGAKFVIEGDHCNHSIGGVLVNDNKIDKATDDDNIVMNLPEEKAYTKVESIDSKEKIFMNLLEVKDY
ncbi:hypothetical protein NE237_016891 [Protea cynaroides]|uniref:Uncharacterized protein n=1 Tax=Protea cynaroides TaxID=273540 RepID=A0A9Q0K6N9_9MAGN|nr:hypothetical protein NE237_016891 [Protea cynaroides]